MHRCSTDFAAAHSDTEILGEKMLLGQDKFVRVFDDGYIFHASQTLLAIAQTHQGIR